MRLFTAFVDRVAEETATTRGGVFCVLSMIIKWVDDDYVAARATVNFAR